MPAEKFKLSELIGACARKLRFVEDHYGIHSDVTVIVKDKDGLVKFHSFQHNLRTNVGADFWNTQLFSTSAAGSQANYIAMTTDTGAAAAGDTTLTSEETLNGLARAQGTVNHTGSATTTTITKTFTYTGSSLKTIHRLGLFTAVSSGTLVLETVLNADASVNANGDTIAITWTINY